MTLFYLTGLSGSGKSAVRAELQARGYFARGVDEDGYADWVNRATGVIDKFPRDDPEFDFHAWYRTHSWELSARRIGRLRAVAARLGVPAYLCGGAAGDGAVWHLFDQVMALVIDVPTMQERITGRENPFGQDPEEMALLLRLRVDYEANYRRFGATIIDASRPLSEVVDEVLAVTSQG